jgi:hypothetical protein
MGENCDCTKACGFHAIDQDKARALVRGLYRDGCAVMETTFCGVRLHKASGSEFVEECEYCLFERVCNAADRRAFHGNGAAASMPRSDRAA